MTPICRLSTNGLSGPVQPNATSLDATFHGAEGRTARAAGCCRPHLIVVTAADGSLELSVDESCTCSPATN